MDSPSGQDRPAVRRSGGRSGATRAAILAAAAELIGELGWGRVTTRAIANRPGVPHGAISYHFAGREDLLREAAVAKLAELFGPPLALAKTAPGVAQLIEETIGWFKAGNLSGPAAGILVEILCQGTRDDRVREQAAAILREYRASLGELISAGPRNGGLSLAASGGEITSEGLAVVLAAVMDGLLLHTFIDPDLDLRAAGAALRGLLAGPGG